MTDTKNIFFKINNLRWKNACLPFFSCSVTKALKTRRRATNSHQFFFVLPRKLAPFIPLSIPAAIFVCWHRKPFHVLIASIEGKTSRLKRQGSVTVNYNRDYEKSLQQVRFSDVILCLCND